MKTKFQSEKIFPVGYYNFHKTQFFNFQLNRWYSIGLARYEDMLAAGKNIKKYEKEIGGSIGIDVTGGMIHKVKKSLEMCRDYGLKAMIINGKRKDNLRRAIVGEKIVGTLIL